MKSILPLWLSFIFFWSFQAWCAVDLGVDRVSHLSPTGGNPGAEVLSVQFHDGMSIKVAIYKPNSSSRPPVGIISGYTMDISYLHTMAEELVERGFPVFLVQAPGNGDGQMRSKMPDNRDGYHNTIEGFGALYLDGLGKAMATHFGKKVVLLGHSRGGYQVRFFLTGLRHAGVSPSGKPLLKYSKQALEEARNNFLAVGSLYSPISPDAEMISLVDDSRRTFDMLNELERIMRKDQESLNFLLNPFRIGFIDKLQKLGAEVGEGVVRKKLVDLLRGKRQLNSDDAKAYEFMRRVYGSEIKFPSWEQHKRNVMRAQTISKGADAEPFEHTLKFGSRSGPTSVAERDLKEISSAKSGIASWKTVGVDTDGKSYSLIRAMRRARTDVALPYLIFEATGDGSSAIEASRREARLLCAAGHCVVEGSHGGAVMSYDSIGDMADELRKHCQALLSE